MSASPPDHPSQRSEPPAQPGAWERQVLEKLVLEVVTEKRRARRWSIFFRFVLLGIVALIFFGGMVAEFGNGTITGPHTALIELNGEIAIDSQASADNINTALRDAFSNPQTRGVILRINRPGGSP
ncbi:MAG: S49 family peptidase, partial [Thiomonas sp.]